MTSLDAIHYAVLFGGTLIGETLGSLVGGGSFIVQPTVLLIGLNMHQAIALDITASCMTSVTGLTALRQAERIPPLKILGPPAAAGVIGALIGPAIMNALSATALAWVFAIAAVMVVILSFQKSGNYQSDNPKSAALVAIGFILGIYTGLSGAGSGILAVILLTRFGGLSVIGSVATRKCIFIPATLVAALSYAMHGTIPWAPLIPMAAGCAIAGWIGTRLLIKLGDVRMAQVFKLAALASAVVTVWSLVNR